MTAARSRVAASAPSRRTLTPTSAPLRALARACVAGAPRHARPWRANCASSLRWERGFRFADDLIHD